MAGRVIIFKGILVFLGVILLMIVGTLFCFWGYKYLRTVLFLGIGVAVCYGSYLLVEPMTANLVIRMFLTVSLTFLGMCFAYFLDIVFSYLLDRLRVRSALGKRVYLVAAPLGAVILGLTIYFYIWRDGAAALGIALCCLIPGLIFQHHRRKKMVRFRCYNDLLRLRRPRFDEDGLEILSVGAAGAVSLPTVSSVLTSKEPEPESAPAPEPEVMEPETAASAAETAEPVPGPVPFEMSDNVKELLLRKMETDEELLEEAFFVKKISKKLAEKQEEERRRAEAQREEDEDIRIEKIAPVYPGKITITKKDRKSRRRREEGIARGAAIAAAGLGAFLAGRISKGGD